MYPLLIAIAVLPVIILSVYIYRQDKFEKEPIGMLIKAFIFGALSIIPAIVMESVLSAYTPVGMPVLQGAYTGFVVAGFSEEFCKLFMLWWAVWRSRHFDEYFDGIVYAAFVSLGFACFENFSYVFGQETYASALVTGSVRAVLSVPGHFLFGVTMGYYFALAKFQPSNRFGNFLKALIVPALLHGTFDALLMIPENMGEGAGIIASVLFVVFVWFDIKLWKIATRRLRHLQELTAKQANSQSNYDNYNNDQHHDDYDHSSQREPQLGGGKSLDQLSWD